MTNVDNSILYERWITVGQVRLLLAYTSAGASKRVALLFLCSVPFSGCSYTFLTIVDPNYNKSRPLLIIKSITLFLSIQDNFTSLFYFIS